MMARIDRNDGSVADAHAYLLDLRSQPVYRRQARTLRQLRDTLDFLRQQPPLQIRPGIWSPLLRMRISAQLLVLACLRERGGGLFFWGRDVVVGDWG